MQVLLIGINHQEVVGQFLHQANDQRTKLICPQVCQLNQLCVHDDVVCAEQVPFNIKILSIELHSNSYDLT